MYYDKDANCFQEKKVYLSFILEFLFIYDENAKG